MRSASLIQLEYASKQWKSTFSYSRTPAPTACGWRTPTARPVGRRPGEGQRLTPDAPDNGGGPTPPGTAPHHPRVARPPQGMQAEGTAPGPDTRTPAPTAREDDGPRQPAQRADSRGRDLRRSSQRTRGPRNPGCPPLRNTGNTGHGDSAGPRTRAPVPTARGQRAPTAPRRRAAGGGGAPGLGRPSQRGRHGPRGGST